MPIGDLQSLSDRLGEIVRTEKKSVKAIARARPVLEELLTRRLVEEKYLRPIPGRPAAYLVYRPSERSYSIISMVWGAGQRFPIHDHLSWGLIGVYSNAIREVRYRQLDDGSREGYAEIEETGVKDFSEGEILEEGLVFDETRRDDIHRILNPNEKPSVSIHILASDLGMKKRHQYDPVAKTVRNFVSGYDDPEGRLDGRIVAGDDRSELLRVSPEAHLDTRGLACPLPTYHTVSKLNEIATGRVLEVLTDSEESAFDDIPGKLKAKGHEFVVLEHRDGYWKIRVRR